MKTPRGYGRCGSCRYIRLLTTTGVHQRHKDKAGNPCPGSGSFPKPDAAPPEYKNGPPPKTYRIDDVRYLLESGVCVTDICRRVDSTPGAISQQLYRAGLKDIAAPFERHVAAERRRRAA